jgi:hypothetical protein
MQTISKSTHLVRVIRLMLLVVVSIAVLARAAAWFANAQSLPADALTTCTVTAPVFASWFETGHISKAEIALTVTLQTRQL